MLLTSAPGGALAEHNTGALNELTEKHLLVLTHTSYTACYDAMCLVCWRLNHLLIGKVRIYLELQQRQRLKCQEGADERHLACVADIPLQTTQSVNNDVAAAHTGHNNTFLPHTAATDT